MNPKHFAFIPDAILISGEDKDLEVMKAELGDQLELSHSVVEESVTTNGMHDTAPDDNYDPLPQLEAEARAVVTDMLNNREPQVQVDSSYSKMVPFVQSSRHVTYKSSLISHLNRNPFLSKDRLTWVKNSIFLFNNSDDCVSVAKSTSTIGVEINCGIYFVQRRSTKDPFNC